MPKCQFGVVRLGVVILLLISSSLPFAADEKPLPGGQSFGDWVVRCNSAEKPLITCVMTQMAIVEASSEQLMRINIAYQASFTAGVTDPSEEKTTIQITLPLGISLHKSPQLFIEGMLREDAPIGICLADGCYSTFALNEKLLAELLKMNKGAMRVQAGNGEYYDLPISGKGTRAAYRAMLTIARKLMQGLPKR